MNLQFYMVPGSCSTGIHILLEELEKIFEVHIVNIPKGDNKKADYLAINPKGTIPTLVLENGTSLTEFQAIAYYLAYTSPRSKLLPEDPIQAAKTLETMAYVVNTLHGQGFARYFAPDSFMFDGSNDLAVKDRGIEIVRNGFETIDKGLANSNFDKSEFTIADAALFYVEFWADKINIAMPDNCQLHYEKMLSRPVVKRVLQEEGYY